MRKSIYIFFFITITTLLLSCNSYNKVLKSTDYDKKYDTAMEYYEKENYFKASQLFENLSLYYRGREKSEKVALYYAMSLLGMKDHFSAGYQFELFYKQFPYSSSAENALYLAAYCKYLESPVYSLDQTLTKEAIKNFNMYLERYPSSSKVEEVNRHIDELRGKLIRKDYEIAYSYYKTSAYLSARIALSEFLYQYPETTYREDAMFYLILSGYEYARNSIKEKQIVRYQQMIGDIDQFIVYFKNSDRKKEVQRLYEKGKAEIALLEKNK